MWSFGDYTSEQWRGEDAHREEALETRRIKRRRDKSLLLPAAVNRFIAPQRRQDSRLLSEKGTTALEPLTKGTRDGTRTDPRRVS